MNVYFDHLYVYHLNSVTSSIPKKNFSSYRRVLATGAESARSQSIQPARPGLTCIVCLAASELAVSHEGLLRPLHAPSGVWCAMLLPAAGSVSFVKYEGLLLKPADIKRRSILRGVSCLVWLPSVGSVSTEEADVGTVPAC